jgi:hypothetical protein
MAAMVVAFACVDHGVIGGVTAPLEAAPSAASAPPPDDDSLDATTRRPVACHDDCASRWEVCDEFLGECVPCRRGRCERIQGCDPFRDDCLRCRDDFDCPASIPLCFDRQCHRCPPGHDRDPQCNPRVTWPCTDRPCDSGASGAGSGRDRDGRDARVPEPDAGVVAGSGGM